MNFYIIPQVSHCIIIDSKWCLDHYPWHDHDCFGTRLVCSIGPAGKEQRRMIIVSINFCNIDNAHTIIVWTIQLYSVISLYSFVSYYKDSQSNISEMTIVVAMEINEVRVNAYLIGSLKRGWVRWVMISGN